MMEVKEDVMLVGIPACIDQLGWIIEFNFSGHGGCVPSWCSGNFMADAGLGEFSSLHKVVGLTIHRMTRAVTIGFVGLFLRLSRKFKIPTLRVRRVTVQTGMLLLRSTY